jgi:N-succinyldiaminopimelate aminotransferase
MQETLRRFRQFTVFAAPTPLQLAVAEGLGFADSYFRQLAAGYQERRDFLVRILASYGLMPNTPAGGLFTMCDISEMGFSDGRAFCNELAHSIGVVAVPTDTFYLTESIGRHIVRFTFSIKRSLLEEAARRFRKLTAMHVVDR